MKKMNKCLKNKYKLKENIKINKKIMHFKLAKKNRSFKKNQLKNKMHPQNKKTTKGLEE